MAEHIEEELLDILEAAIYAEKSSQERYRSAGKISKNPASKALFQTLEEEEKLHEKKLQEKYISIKKALGFKIINKE